MFSSISEEFPWPWLNPRLKHTHTHTLDGICSVNLGLSISLWDDLSGRVHEMWWSLDKCDGMRRGREEIGLSDAATVMDAEGTWKVPPPQQSPHTTCSPSPLYPPWNPMRFQFTWYNSLIIPTSWFSSLIFFIWWGLFCKSYNPDTQMNKCFFTFTVLVDEFNILIPPID